MAWRLLAPKTVVLAYGMAIAGGAKAMPRLTVTGPHRYGGAPLRQRKAMQAPCHYGGAPLRQRKAMQAPCHCGAAPLRGRTLWGRGKPLQGRNGNRCGAVMATVARAQWQRYLRATGRRYLRATGRRYLRVLLRQRTQPFGLLCYNIRQPGVAEILLL